MADAAERRRLQTLVDDTQAALAAALARIEAFRVRERQLINELSALRKQVHGAATPPAPASPARPIPAAAGAATPVEVSQSQQTPPARRESQELRPSSTCSISIPVGASPAAAPAFTGLATDAPLYVSSLNASEQVVGVWLQGDRDLEKINCQMILDKDRLDFVQLRVRVKSEDFIGITAVKERSKTGDSGGGPFACCFGPPASAPDNVDDTVSGDDALPHAQADITSANDGAGGGWDAAGRPNSPPQPQRGRYRIYLRGREQRPIEFEASQATRAALHKHTQRWLGQEDEAAEEGAPGAASNGAGEEQVSAPHHLTPGPPMRLLGPASHILSSDHVAALASVVPPLERMRDWGLAYSTKVHGISLSTLYRRVNPGQLPTLLVIRDNAGHVFGCYTPEGWKVAPRYYGSGESFVFQLEPSRVMWPWKAKSTVKNDFFQYSTPDYLALGGAGHFALHVDQELLQGSSGVCGTFGSPCLSGGEDFLVHCLEVWQVTS